jgi:hypothetical protein
LARFVNESADEFHFFSNGQGALPLPPVRHATGDREIIIHDQGVAQDPGGCKVGEGRAWKLALPWLRRPAAGGMGGERGAEVSGFVGPSSWFSLGIRSAARRHSHGEGLNVARLQWQMNDLVNDLVFQFFRTNAFSKQMEIMSARRSRDLRFPVSNFHLGRRVAPRVRCIAPGRSCAGAAGDAAGMLVFRKRTRGGSGVWAERANFQAGRPPDEAGQ